MGSIFDGIPEAVPKFFMHIARVGIESCIKFHFVERCPKSIEYRPFLKNLKSATRHGVHSA
jgi:hypothetical protein